MIWALLLLLRYTAGPANFYTKAQTYLTTILRRILFLPKAFKFEPKVCTEGDVEFNTQYRFCCYWERSSDFHYVCFSYQAVLHYLSCRQISQSKCYKQSDTVFMHSFNALSNGFSVLLSVLHFKTILLMDPDWLLKVSHQISRRVLDGNTVSAQHLKEQLLN